MNKETLNGAAVHGIVQEGPRIILKPTTMINIDTICKTLPTFVDVLRSYTCCTIKRLGLQILLGVLQMMLLNPAMIYSETFNSLTKGFAQMSQKDSGAGCAISSEII